MNGDRPIALWAVPRSISTAFERVFVERDDFEVLHEPFSNAYYYGTDRLSDRYADAEPRPEYSFDSVLADVLAPREKRVFVKDMAYQAKGVLSPEFALESFSDLEGDVRQSMARIQASPFIPHKDAVRGFVYEVETGRLREVAAA